MLGGEENRASIIGSETTSQKELKSYMEVDIECFYQDSFSHVIGSSGVQIAGSQYGSLYCFWLSQVIWMGRRRVLPNTKSSRKQRQREKTTQLEGVLRLPISYNEV